ncbi:MAG: ATP-binding protein, partial [Myxococcota bacterium]
APRHHVFRVLWNLALNAVQALGRGGGQLVELEAGASADGPFVEVRDDGPGLPESLGDPFAAFVTGRHDGTGLGLHLAERTVREAGGRLSVRHREGGGTAFRVALPARVAEPPRSATRLRASTGAVPRVLVIEDDPGLRELVVTALTLRGYAVSGVGEGQPVLEDDAKWGIVLADLSLPDVRGDRVLAELVSAGRARHTVLMSGAASPGPLAIEPDRAIRKPFLPSELVALVDALDVGRLAAG